MEARVHVLRSLCDEVNGRVGRLCAADTDVPVCLWDALTDMECEWSRKTCRANDIFARRCCVLFWALWNGDVQGLDGTSCVGADGP